MILPGFTPIGGCKVFTLQQHSHPAIVSEEVYDLVQLEIEARREYGNRYSGKGLFASRIICSDCGGYFGSKVWHSTDRYRKVIWRCNNKYEDGSSKEQRCTTPHVTEFEIMDAFVRAMGNIIENKNRILDECREIIDAIMVMDDLDRRICALQDQAQGMAQRIRELVSENARISRDQKDFQSEYEPLTRRYEELTKKIAAAQTEKADKEMRAKRISLFVRLLKDQEACVEFDPVLFTAFVEKVIVRGSKRDPVLVFMMRDGSEHTIAVHPKPSLLAQ